MLLVALKFRWMMIVYKKESRNWMIEQDDSVGRDVYG